MDPSSDIRVTTPDKVDLREYLWPVENVGQVFASAASAAAVALEYHCNRMGEEPTNLSSLFIHYNARAASGQEGMNRGTTLEAAMKAIAAHGACREASWPFDASKATIKPPAQAYEEARKFAGVGYMTPADPVEALALGYPVAVVVSVPERCLREAGKTGIMPAPTAEEARATIGLVHHAMVLVGYDRPAGTFTVRNCWGPTWGNQGHCAVSFDILKSIAPFGTQRHWIITQPQQARGDAATAGYGAAPLAAAAPAERLSDMTARLRDEIRGDLQRDIADSAKRIRDMVNRPAAPPQQNVTRDACSACSGRGVCWGCGGRGCATCGGSGTCSKCGGRGTA